MSTDPGEMSDADAAAVRIAIADAGMEAIGWTLGQMERTGLAAAIADSVTFMARGLAHFRIGLLDRAARYNWTHRQRCYLALYATAPAPAGGDLVFIANLADAMTSTLVFTGGPPLTIVALSSQEIIATADKLQSAVANDLQAAGGQAAGSDGHGRGEKFITFRLTMQDN